MSAYGQELLWAALAFFIYGVAQLFTRPSLVFPSQMINTAFFLRTFGIPVQLLRGLAAVAIAITLGRALRAFEQEGGFGWRAPTRRASRRRPPRWRPNSAAPGGGGAQRPTGGTARELSALVEMSRILTSTMDRRRLLDNALYQVVHSFERPAAASSS